MRCRIPRPRLLDVAVALTCVALIGAPFVATSGAIEAPITETKADVDQRVPQLGIISHPRDVAFDGGTSGVVNGSVSWDVYSTASSGMKLAVAASRDPALRDTANGVDVEDLAGSLGEWSVGDGQRRFGFTVTGDMSLGRYDSGAKWRGFDGTTGVMAARRGGQFARTATTVKVRGEYRAALASGATPSATVTGTAVVNL